MNIFKKRAPIVILFILIIFGTFYLKPWVQDQLQLNTNNSYQFLRLNILKIIKKDGVPKATDRVVKAFENGIIDINECHNLMHTLGHSAYEFHPNDWSILISPKSTVCFFGFEHGVEAQIVLSKLTDPDTMYKDLHLYCAKFREKFPDAACYHGVGHASIQSMTLTSALANCDKVAGKDDDPSDCYLGAFSEYINKLKGMDGDTDAPIPGATPVVIQADHAYDECFKLDLKYQKACVAQFTYFMDKGDLDSSLIQCDRYKNWVGSVCAAKFSESYTVNNIETITIPEHISEFSPPVRKGYIDGTIIGYIPYKQDPIFKKLSTLCQHLPISSDREYCINAIP